MTGAQDQTITGHLRFEQYEVDVEIGGAFAVHDIGVYNCVVCCNPLKLSYDVYEGEISSLSVSDGNE